MFPLIRVTGGTRGAGHEISFVSRRKAKRDELIRYNAVGYGTAARIIDPSGHEVEKYDKLLSIMGTDEWVMACRRRHRAAIAESI